MIIILRLTHDEFSEGESIAYLVFSSLTCFLYPGRNPSPGEKQLQIIKQVVKQIEPKDLFP